MGWSSIPWQDGCDIKCNSSPIYNKKCGQVGMSELTVLSIRLVEDSKLSSYRNWIEQRKMLRKDLNNCGKLDDWLNSKPSLSEVEHRVHINIQEMLDKKVWAKHRVGIYRLYILRMDVVKRENNFSKGIYDRPNWCLTLIWMHVHQKFCGIRKCNIWISDLVLLDSIAIF